jgi:hypothetical protein
MELSTVMLIYAEGKARNEKRYALRFQKEMVVSAAFCDGLISAFKV